MTFRVLVVDDHPMMRGALRTALELLAEDVIVAPAGSLQDAFRQLATQPLPDLVLLDLNLPDACGTATIGTPCHRPSEQPPIPAWVTNACARPSTESCGTQRCTVVLAGTGPSAARSVCAPTCTTISRSRSPKAAKQSR